MLQLYFGAILFKKAESGLSLWLDQKLRNSKILEGLSQWLSNKESACRAGDAGDMALIGRTPGGGNGSSPQYSCLTVSWTEEPGGQPSKE